MQTERDRSGWEREGEGETRRGGEREESNTTQCRNLTGITNNTCQLVALIFVINVHVHTHNGHTHAFSYLCDQEPTNKHSPQSGHTSTYMYMYM